jgi:hypothetical protein
MAMILSAISIEMPGAFRKSCNNRQLVGWFWHVRLHVRVFLIRFVSRKVELNRQGFKQFDVPWRGSAIVTLFKINALLKISTRDAIPSLESSHIAVGPELVHKLPCKFQPMTARLKICHLDVLKRWRQV